MSISVLTQDQVLKVVKAVLYSFVSAAVAALVATNYNLTKQTGIAVLVAGINGALVTIKQLFTTATKV